jgi:GT2 family glycosyltransferase
MKILHVMFSTNRIKYLIPTLESLNKLDYGDHTVDKLIIDDYPRNRNPAIFDLVSKVYGFNVTFNETNLGLSVNWSAFFDWLKEQDYDYILHQEDDVLLNRRIRIDDMINCLESDCKMASVVLQRQPWYFHEQETKIEEGDIPFGNYWYSKNVKTFPIIFSLYRKSILEYSFREYWKFNVNEGMVMVYLNFIKCMLQPLKVPTARI